MPIRVTDYLNLDSKVFNSTGAFDTILDIDTKLYISPLLLHRVEIPELSNSYIHIQEHFQKILILLRNSKQKNDRAWREASKLLRFQEPKWLPLGYSSEKSSGRGIGKDLQTQLTNAAKEIIDIGVAEPEIFELMGLIENNIGPDLISDMIASIILPDLLKFSVRIFNKIGINSINLSEYSFKEESYNCRP